MYPFVPPLDSSDVGDMLGSCVQVVLAVVGANVVIIVGAIAGALVDAGVAIL